MQPALQLPIIHIYTDTIIPWEDRIPCTVSVVADRDSIIYDGKIKFRGGISSKFYKHSYALKLATAQSFCHLPENKSWILNASYIDKTFMRHKLCYDLFNMMGEADLAPKCAYALVRENEKPQGLYVVMQRLNRKVLKVDKNDPCAVIFKEPKLFYSDKKIMQRGSQVENPHGQTYPDYDKEHRDAIITDFRNFILNTSDAEFYTNIGKWIDLSNLIDWHLFVMFSNSGDGVLKNFYLYKKDTNTPFRIALWDCDHSFGRDGDNEKNMLEHLPNIRRNILIDRMMKSPEYMEKLQKCYAELRESGIFSYKNIERMMQENDPYVRLGLEENTRLWPIDSKDYYDAANYDEEYALILEFVKLSLDRMDKEMQYQAK
ncbi:MAG: CotH kinase family protein [Bacteroidales bacterium]|nr:CotH kinase family protein [Bacteroidales bacterium]